MLISNLYLVVNATDEITTDSSEWVRAEITENLQQSSINILEWNMEYRRRNVDTSY